MATYRVVADTNVSGRVLPEYPQGFATRHEAWIFAERLAESYARLANGRAMLDANRRSLDPDEDIEEYEGWRAGSLDPDDNLTGYAFAFDDWNDANGEVRYSVKEIAVAQEVGRWSI